MICYHMIIAIDIRPLLTRPQTGIGMVTQELVQACINRPEHTWILFYTGRKTISFPKSLPDHVQVVHVAVPNKLIHMTIRFFSYPKIDWLIKKYTSLTIDACIFPNLGFWSLSPEIPSVLVVHDMSFYLFPECFTTKQQLWHRYIQPKKQIKRATHIITPSQSTAHDIQRIVGIEKNTVAHLGIPTSICTFRDSTNQAKKQAIGMVKQRYELPPTYMLFLGSIEPRKNMRYVLEMVAQWKKQYSRFTRKYTLVIAGSKGWKQTDIHRYMQEASDIIYLDYIDEQDKAALIAGAQVVIFPSIYEGFGLPVLEAMALETPVITSARGALLEVAQDAALYCDITNVQSGVDCLYRLFEDKELYRTLQTKGQKQSRTFSFNHFVDLILEKLQSSKV